MFRLKLCFLLPILLPEWIFWHEKFEYVDYNNTVTKLALVTHFLLYLGSYVYVSQFQTIFNPNIDNRYPVLWYANHNQAFVHHHTNHLVT